MKKCRCMDLKGYESVLCLTMAISLMLVQVLPAVVGIASPQVVYVFDSDDLCKLSKDCSFDKWSKGRTVVLMDDIDLKHKEFTPIPIFGGIFDGQGYSITGLSIKVEGSNQGLFRYVQEGGVVKNLIVEGSVVPEGDKSNVGGVVGNNSGLLENCSFSGRVEGKDNVGGLVGRNGTLGKIINCCSSGVVYGKSKAGGIAGSNAGTILRCKNESSVNTTVEERRLESDELTVDDISPLRSFVDVIDIGGIAGLNVGVVKGSENSGEVGYPHVGYNVGGIAGRQSGYVSECLNYGKICGQKEVGGIVGQMEPYVTATIPPSKLKELHKEINYLESTVDELLGGVKSSSGVINQDISCLQDDLDSTRVYAESLINQTESLINKDVEEINRISLVAIEAMDKLIPVVDELADVVDVIDKALYPIEQSLYYFARALEKLPEVGDRYGKLVGEMDYSIDKLIEAGDSAGVALSYLVEALELLYNGETDGVSELLDSAWDKLDEAGKIVEEAVDSLKRAQEQMNEIIMILGAMGGDVGRALDYLRFALEILEDAMGPISAALRQISGLLDYLAKQPKLEFQTTDDVYRETKENLFRSIDDTSNSLFQLINTMKREGDMLIDDFQRVSDQLFVVLDLALEIAEEASEAEIDPDKVYEDVSRNDADGITEGKVSSSKNFGRVEGDVNVGGVTGAMALELLSDAEEELSVKDKPSLMTVFKTRASMINCENQGEVVGKKSNVGGLVGNMDLGYIKGCIATGLVESVSGDYVGGIAGKGNGPICSSYAKCALRGDNYVGGIAGLAKEVTNCCSMVVVERSRACVGAIAGYVDEGSVIRNNYFVSSVLAGIDGISYANRAEPITYEELIAIGGLPSVFMKFKARFWADGKIVDMLEFSYGGCIAQTDIPKIPPKPGHYGRWKGLDVTNVTCDIEVHAEYFPYITVLESCMKREGPLSAVLVEGDFTDEDGLLVNQVAETAWEDGLFPDDEEVLEMWIVSIPEDGNSTHTVRFMPPEKAGNLAIYVLEDGKWAQAKSRWDGKYMVFEPAGYVVTFSLVKAGLFYGKRLALLGAVVIAAVLPLVVKLVIRKNGSGASVQSE
jgi:tetratricopeptide (TPR) repeat protein